MKVVFITGGSRGIGLALVDELLRHDFFVINFSRSAINYSHEKLKQVYCDLAKIEAAQTFTSELKSVINQYGKSVNEWILINNAGVLEPISPIGKFTNSEAISNHFSINIVNPIQFVSVFIESLKQFECKKTVINVGSGAANHAIEGWALYGSSKAALHYFTETVAIEQNREQNPVTMILFDPGKTDTGMQATIRSAYKSDFPLVENFQKAFEEGNLNSPTKLAEKLVEKIVSNSLKQGEIVSHKELLK